MARNLLHKNKVEEFKQWLSEKGIKYRDGRGDYQIIQVQVSGTWACLYNRDDMPEHVTNDRRLNGLIRYFIRER